MSNCKPCDLPNTNPLLDIGTCEGGKSGVDDGMPTTDGGSCVVQPGGATSCPDNKICSPWDLSKNPDASCIIADYIEESLNIGGAILNVHRLLGVHEQGLLQDTTGNGTAMSGGELPNFPAANAYDKYVTEWRSSQTGADVISSSFLGYDFGPIKLSNGRDRYGVETYVKKDISRLRIKQSCNKNNRATKARIERSSDGQKWFGVAIIKLEDCDGLITVDFSRTVPSRYWRIRPITFNGGQNDYWAVQALQMVEYEATHISNIQDKIFMENRDRDYDEFPVEVKGQYTPVDVQTMMGKWGPAFDSEMYFFDVSFKQTVARLGRPIVIGDIIQLPSETQYTPSLTPVLKYLEVTDVAWSTNGFTPNWVPTTQKITAKPALASQETQDVIGKITRSIDSSGLLDIDDGLNNKKYQDMHDISQTINADANTAVPAKGEDFANATEFSDKLKEFSDNHPQMNIRKMNRNRSIFGIDAIPPNGLPFTEADTFPESPADGVYHRLTYTHIGKNIPARLYKYSSVKDRWIFLESDHRAAISADKPLLDEYASADTSTQTPVNKIDKALNP